MSLYTELKAAGCELDSHESDLYVVATPAALAILKSYRAGGRLGGFTAFGGTDGRVWYEAAFMFEPWWDARVGVKS